MGVKQRIIACSVGAVVALVGALFPGELKTSKRGQTHIANWEACIRCTYQDSVGVNTIGLGATRGLDGKAPAQGQVITDAQVAELFVRDLKVNEKCVMERMNGARMPQSVFDASVSLVHNVGCAGATWNAKKQTKTVIRLYAEKGNWPAVCDAMTQFVFAGGKKLPGLVNRRNGDKALCMEDLK